MNIQNLVLDINKKPFQIITANTGEVASRFIRINIVDGATPLDLTGITVSIYAEKPDGKKVFNNVTIEDKTNGIVLAELTSQVLAVEGSVKLNLLLEKDNARLCTKQFLLKVDKSLVDDEAIESINEFGVLTKALDKVDVWNGYFEETSGKIEEKYTERLNQVDSQLAQNTNFTKKILKAKDNTPTKIEELLCNMTGKNTSGILENTWENVNGVLELEAGVFYVDSVILRSNITIKGQGIGKTIIIPTPSNRQDFLFKSVNTSHGSRLCNFELKDLSIMAGIGYQYNIKDYNERFNRAIIDFSYTTSCRLTNVIISGFGGSAIKCLEHYDSDFTNIQIIGCGDETNPSFNITVGDNDGCNAFRINNFRFEKCSKVFVNAKDSKLQREIHFIGGKIEETQLHIESSTNINIVATHFTWNDTENPVVKLSKFDRTEQYGIKFNSCSFLSTKGGVGIYNTTTVVEISSCSFKGFDKTIYGDKFNIQNCEFYDCNSPVINIESNNIIIGNWFRGTRGNDYICKFTNLNTIAFNNAYGSITTNPTIYVGNENDLIWNGNGIRFSGVTNFEASNNYQKNNTVKLPHNTSNEKGNIKYDINTKLVYVSDGVEWRALPKGQSEWQAPCNTTNIADIQTTLNGLIAKLVSSGVMKSH